MIVQIVVMEGHIYFRQDMLILFSYYCYIKDMLKKKTKIWENIT